MLCLWLNLYHFPSPKLFSCITTRPAIQSGPRSTTGTPSMVPPIFYSGKVLSKIGITLTQDDIKRLSNSSPMAIEHLLYEVKCFVDEHSKQKQN